VLGGLSGQCGIFRPLLEFISVVSSSCRRHSWGAQFVAHHGESPTWRGWPALTARVPGSTRVTRCCSSLAVARPRRDDDRHFENHSSPSPTSGRVVW
jgi:hypothetical protein